MGTVTRTIGILAFLAGLAALLGGEHLFPAFGLILAGAALDGAGWHVRRRERAHDAALERVVAAAERER